GRRPLVPVNLGYAQLPPEQLGRVHDGDDRLDSLRHDAALDQRPRALIVGKRDAELEKGSSHGGMVGWVKSLCVSSLRGQRHGGDFSPRTRPQGGLFPPHANRGEPVCPASRGGVSLKAGFATLNTPRRTREF